MRVLPPLMVEALMGSVPDARVVFHAFYDGLISSIDPIPVGEWSLKTTCRERTMVRSSGSFTVADGTGSLAPWGLSESLSAAGSQVTMDFQCGGESVDIGRFTVTDNRPDESLFVAGDRWVSAGAQVGVSFEELARLIQDDEFISPESPPPGATVVSELQRILQGRVGVLVDDDVVDVVLPSMVHPENRVEAVYTLVSMVGDARFTGDGQLNVYVPNTGSSFTIRGKATGNLVSLGRGQSRDSFYNVVVSTGKSSKGDELKAYSVVRNGPLADGGPFGRRVYRHTAVASTQSGVQADADSTLARLMSTYTVEITVECVPDLSIEAGDTGTVLFPAMDGKEYPVTGRVLDVDLSGGPNGFNPMRLVLACPAADVQRIGGLLESARRNP